ncbi:MAG: hypothetical protein ACYDAG_07550 [Chloroflexota bacterium]
MGDKRQRNKDKRSTTYDLALNARLRQLEDGGTEVLMLDSQSGSRITVVENLMQADAPFAAIGYQFLLRLSHECARRYGPQQAGEGLTRLLQELIEQHGKLLAIRLPSHDGRACVLFKPSSWTNHQATAMATEHGSTLNLDYENVEVLSWRILKMLLGRITDSIDPLRN